jgi:purine-binding chemotaxis protein CheW
MSLLSPLRSKHLRRQNTEVKTRQIVAFQLKQEWFGLPIEAVERVVELGDRYGKSDDSGVSLTIYRGQEMVVVDMGARLFKTPQPTEIFPGGQPASLLLVLQTAGDSLMGIPIDTPPVLRRMPESAFSPLPTTYAINGDLQCVGTLAIQAEGQPPIFVIDPDHLLQS